jgi:hypothetical protein
MDSLCSLMAVEVKRDENIENIGFSAHLKLMKYLD